MSSAEIVIYSFFFIFGAIIGSFLNAVIYRLPRQISLSKSRSMCPHCKKLIHWYENIPLISYVLLRGRCKGCNQKILFRYFSVEAICAVTSVLLVPGVLSWNTMLIYIFQFFIFSVFVAHFFIDLEHKLLPNILNIYLAFLFLGYALIMNFSWGHIVFGGLVGFGFTWCVSLIFYLLKGQVGLGGGDIKLYGALGLFVGPLGIIQNIFLSCFVGAVIGLALIVTKKLDKNNPIPFGPFILVVATFQIYLPELFSRLMSQILVS